MIKYDREVLNEIATINQLFPRPDHYLLALMLASKFQGQILYNSVHCITKINDIYYDINGIVTSEDRDKELIYLSLEYYGPETKKRLMINLMKSYKK